MQQLHCEGCGEIVASYDSVHYGSQDKGYRELCTRCVNAEVAKLSGLDDFKNIRLEPIGITDCAGETHLFHFRTRLSGSGVALDAFELREGNPAGYQFQAIGDPDDDQFALLGRLIGKVRRTLSLRHLEDDGHGLRIAHPDSARADRMGWAMPVGPFAPVGREFSQAHLPLYS